MSNCSGLSLTGYNVIYNYGASSYQVTQASNSITFPSIPTETYGIGSFEIDPTASSGRGVGSGERKLCRLLDSSTAPADVTITDAGSCSITASQGGDQPRLRGGAERHPVVLDQPGRSDDRFRLDLAADAHGNASFEIDPTATSGLNSVTVLLRAVLALLGHVPGGGDDHRSR